MIILVDARMYGLENTGIGRYLIQLIEGLKSLSITSKTGKSRYWSIFLTIHCVNNYCYHR